MSKQHYKVVLDVFVETDETKDVSGPISEIISDALDVGIEKSSVFSECEVIQSLSPTIESVQCSDSR